jgi:hypothetical protein
MIEHQPCCFLPCKNRKNFSRHSARSEVQSQNDAERTPTLFLPAEGEAIQKKLDRHAASRLAMTVTIQF